MRSPLPWLTVLLLFPLLAHARVGLSQSLKYQPRVGHPLVYGIDCMVKPASPGQPISKHRVKLTITPTVVGDESWQAEFATLPIVSTGPLYQPMPLIEPQRGPGPPPGMADVPHLAELHERAFEAEVANYKKRLAERRLLPGLVTAKKGTLTIGTDGTCSDFSTFTSLPLMAGAVWSAPLVVLPPEEGKASYSNKQLLYRLGDEKDPELPDAWLINAWVVEPEKDGLILLKRSIEFAAGDHSGLQIDLSGDGSAWFDPELGVAKSGQIQFTAKQSIYCGVVDGYQMQVGFQWLEEWQQTLFDHYLVPNEKALDKENLARLTAKQISYITSLFNDSKPGSRWDPHDLMELHLYAPMPVDSQLYQVLRREQKRMNSGDQRGGTWYQLEVDIALNRWERVRKLGTLVPRIWKASVGNFQVKAQLVNANESLVTLRRYDNQQEIKVPLEKLSADDQEFVKIFGQGPAEAP